MEDTRQLSMCADLTRPMPELPPCPPGVGVMTAADTTNARAMWEHLIEVSFNGFFSYDMILNDEKCAADRVFFVMLYSQPAATTTVQIVNETTGCIHMVGADPLYGGCGAGYRAVYTAVKWLKDHGFRKAVLKTDDFRLPAIRIYEKLGFEPVAEDESMISRWAKVHEDIRTQKKPEPNRVIPLWPDRVAPFTEQSPEQAQPSITEYAVEGAKSAMVVCPGGGYVMKASHEGYPVARMLNGAGISAYVLDYRVLPCYFETPVTDARRAIRVLRSMGYEKVGIIGFSAGGSLTCCAGTMYDAGDPEAEDPVDRLSSRPDAFVPCYAVATMGKYTHEGSRDALLGEKAKDPETIRRFSAECNVTEDTPPAFIWHASDDTCVPVQNSIQLAMAMAEKKLPFELHIFPRGGHGMGLAADMPGMKQWPDMVKGWLKRLGF